MLDTLTSAVDVETVAPAVVLTGVFLRVYFGHVLFHPRYVFVWNTIRRVGVPLLQKGMYRFLPFNVNIENSAHAKEYVATVSESPTELAKAINRERDVEVPLLAGFKTDWADRTETGTFVWYCGPKPGGLPHWLRKYQVHPTTFEGDGGETIVTGHFEANSYRPDMWLDHLTKGPSHSVEKGVKRIRNAMDDAGVEPVEVKDVPPGEQE